mgnify:CR=1 FL=1|jgi:hypothetical protein
MPPPVQARAVNLTALVVVLAWLVAQQAELGALAASRRQTLVQSCALVFASVAALSQTPGYRRLFGTAHVMHAGKYETVLRMMEDNPAQFAKSFRMTPDTFFFVRDRLWETMYPNNGRAAGARNRGRKPDRLVFERRLLMTIWYLATGHTYREMEFSWGVPYVGWDELLVEPLASLAAEFVRFPAGHNLATTCSEFERLRGFTGCAGCVDGTFIKIDAPHLQAQNPGEFNSYKKFYAIQLLLICTANLMITFMHTGTPGSRTDQWILRRTRLFRNWNQWLPNGLYLFGDVGFKMYTWLIIKYNKRELRTPVSTREKRQRKLFNDDQCSTRVTIEQCIGVLKGRWKILRRGMTCDLHHTATVVQACVVLHNICIAEGDVWSKPTPPAADLNLGTHEPDWFTFDPNIPAPPPDTDGVSQAARAKREAIMRMQRINHRD